MTRRDYICRDCHIVYEVETILGEAMEVVCPRCHDLCSRYFGKMSASDILINYGFRPGHYKDQTEEDIMNYSFTHL